MYNPRVSSLASTPRSLEIPLRGRTWVIDDPARRLELRSSLPGAFTFDHAALALVEARARGVDRAHRFALALASSWLVNNRVASPVFQTWLEPPARDRWLELLDQLEELEAAPTGEALAELDDDHASALAALARRATGRPDALCAMSKVAALCVPGAVPLLDDAAVAFLTEGVPFPADADHPSAGFEHLGPCLRAFHAGLVVVHEALGALGLAQVPALSPAQVLDRLLWFDSWGHRHFGYRRLQTSRVIRTERA